MSTIGEAREANQRDHWAARQRRQLEERGSKGVAEAWWDRVRAACKQYDQQRGPEDPDPWEALARTLENFIEHHAK
ncbi:hypothetical protein ACFXP3_21330 [Streptomyces sp. NPDC059096]|uniref:hypothetical protein n=1 Tax=Streptomyces sp. NPDC059096 TaxID=3346727 RepID=UPI0036776E4B